MTQTPIAEDFGDIAARLKEISSPPAAPRRYAIWFRNQWAGIGTDINKITFFDTAEAAEAALKENSSPEAYAECEIREYPGE